MYNNNNNINHCRFFSWNVCKRLFWNSLCVCLEICLFFQKRKISHYFQASFINYFVKFIFIFLHIAKDFCQYFGNNNHLIIIAYCLKFVKQASKKLWKKIYKVFKKVVLDFTHLKCFSFFAWNDDRKWHFEQNKKIQNHYQLDILMMILLFIWSSTNKQTNIIWRFRECLWLLLFQTGW